MLRKEGKVTLNFSNNLNHKINGLEEVFPHMLETSEICLEAVGKAIRDHDRELTLIEEDIKNCENNILKVEHEIELLEDDKIKLQKELKDNKIKLQKELKELQNYKKGLETEI